MRSRRVPVVTGNQPYVMLKTSVEWCVALILLILTLPLLAFLAHLVKCTSEGPAFYSPLRLGRYGRPFRIYKLRTMAHNCEASTGAVWALQNDPRATALGRWLRLTHLDELPQLCNVLRGEMSLIGPRPERPEIAAKLETALANYPSRLLVRPGVTGLAQMRLPADGDFPGANKKLAHDLHYVRHVSMALDLRIAAATVLHFFASAAEAASNRLVQAYAPPLPEVQMDAPVEPMALVAPALSLSRYNRAGNSANAPAALAAAA
jgi:lipopolysaccharide/colanic/teichoic acid biosynthesis glycosyltransferase